MIKKVLYIQWQLVIKSLCLLHFGCQHHHSILTKGRSFTINSETKTAVLLKGRSSTANSGSQAAVLLGMDMCGSFPLLSTIHSLSLASERWGLHGLMISGAMLAVVYSTDRASHARQVLRERSRQREIPGPPGWGLGHGVDNPFPVKSFIVEKLHKTLAGCLSGKDLWQGIRIRSTKTWCS